MWYLHDYVALCVEVEWACGVCSSVIEEHLLRYSLGPGRDSWFVIAKVLLLFSNSGMVLFLCRLNCSKSIHTY